MAVPKPLLTEFGIHHSLESCVQFSGKFPEFSEKLLEFRANFLLV